MWNASYKGKQAFLHGWGKGHTHNFIEWEGRLWSHNFITCTSCEISHTTLFAFLKCIFQGHWWITPSAPKTNTPKQKQKGVRLKREVNRTKTGYCDLNEITSTNMNNCKYRKFMCATVHI